MFRGGKRKDDIFLCLGAVNVKTTVSVQTRLWQNWRAWWGRSLSIPGGSAIFVDTLYHIQTIRYKLYIPKLLYRVSHYFWQIFKYNSISFEIFATCLKFLSIFVKHFFQFLWSSGLNCIIYKCFVINPKIREMSCRKYSNSVFLVYGRRTSHYN